MTTARWLLLLPLALATLLALAWIVRWSPRGWKRIVAGSTAALVLAVLCQQAWQASLWHLTRGAYTCIACGRTEWHMAIFGVRISSELHESGKDYARSFAPHIAASHPHDWHLESCLYSGRGVSCTMQVIGGWFRALPQLGDRQAAERLVAEAENLPRDERCRLMDEVTKRVWYSRDGEGLDRAFEAWHDARRASSGSK
ncbi:MAG TPA: hypothetical protein VMS76_10460 [Planctomycetota bacterium]|nr:hypothetical protein [Planctomycetota bacterium]